MGLKWLDVQDIAIKLAERHGDVDPMHINFVDLRRLVLALPDFDDEPGHCGEKVLEAIQMAWMEEQD